MIRGDLMRIVIDILLFAFLAFLLIFAVIVSGLLVASAVKAVMIVHGRNKKRGDDDERKNL